MKLPALKALRRPPPPVAASHRALAQPLGLIFEVALTSQGGGRGGSTLLPFLTDEVGAPFVAGLVAGAAAASAGSGGGGAAAPAGVAAAAGAGPAAGAAPAAVPALVVQTPAAYLAARARGTCVVVAPLKVALSAIPAALDGCLPRSADVAPTALAVLCDATGTSYDGVAAALAGSTERSKKEVVTREWRLLRFTSAGGLHWAYGAATYLGAASSRGTGRPTAAVYPLTVVQWRLGLRWVPYTLAMPPFAGAPHAPGPGQHFATLVVGRLVERQVAWRRQTDVMKYVVPAQPHETTAASAEAAHAFAASQAVLETHGQAAGNLSRHGRTVECITHALKVPDKPKEDFRALEVVSIPILTLGEAAGEAGGCHLSIPPPPRPPPPPPAPHHPPPPRPPPLQQTTRCARWASPSPRRSLTRCAWRPSRAATARTPSTRRRR